MSIKKASSELMHMVKEIYRDMTDIITVEVPEEFWNRNFIRHLMPGTWETSKRDELVRAFHEDRAEFRF